jgi:hypothetical protein
LGGPPEIPGCAGEFFVPIDYFWLMSLITQLEPTFVIHIPKPLEPGKLYISEEFEIAIHLCACGCGGQTVTPFGSDGWTLTNQDGKISLRPSIGNWSGQNPYHAHYYVTDNMIQWCD